MDIYQNKAQAYHALIKKLDGVLKQLSALRLAAFILPIVAILILADARLAIWIWLAAPAGLIGFGLIVGRYNKLAGERKHATFLKEINEAELLRLQNELSGFPSGQSFLNHAHAYATDFDLFGQHSLFQLINRTTTISGQQLLAAWLSESATKEVILQRQQAVRELSPKLDWRQDFQASGMPFKSEETDSHKLTDWIEQPVKLLPKQSKYLTISIVLASLATLSTAYFLYGLAYHLDDFTARYMVPMILMLIINAQFLKRAVSATAEEVISHTESAVAILGGYQSLITKIESEPFHSETLSRLQSSFRQHGYSAADQIGKLVKILAVFQQKGTKRNVGGNAFYAILNNFWLLDVHLIMMTEKWKLANRSYLKSWISAVSECEVLSSVAGFSYSNPSFTFPQIEDEPYVIHFQKLGHPLLAPGKRVCNDFSLSGRGEIAMITGSNMAGKSTFLRTVGANLVLALMGAPCCAASAEVSVLKIFTSMRTQDNLQEGVSSFYAELKRIQQLLALIESGEPIFFLLDEMFKGTNSEDRYKGGASLIKQLSELNAFGIISTHDLELARMAAHHLTVANYSFNSKIDQSEIIFNYKLTEGICTDFNASELMRKSGIKILSDIT